MENKIYTGKVEWFNNRGFGVIKYDDGEVFAHYSNIINGTKLFENQNVKFNITKDNNRDTAKNIKILDRTIRPTKNKRRKKKNTESFKPVHKPSDMRIRYCHANQDKYPYNYYSNEIILVNNLFCDENDLTIYHKLLQEIKDSGLEPDKLWKLWHGDTHLIVDDKKVWKNYCPTFNMVINKIKEYFNMDIQATRFNLYKDSSQWKPYHHDAAAIKPDKAKKQNITIAVSFGVEREGAFEHAKTRTNISVPLTNGSIYIFNKDVNIEWRHGIPQVHPDKKHNEGRISIIAWGKVDMKGKYV